MLKLAFLCVAATLAVAATSAATSATTGPLTITDHLSAADQQRLRSHITGNIVSNDLTNHYYGVLYGAPLDHYQRGIYHARGQQLYWHDRDTKVSEFERYAYMLACNTLIGLCDPTQIKPYAIEVIQRQRDRHTSTYALWLYMQAHRHLDANTCNELPYTKLDDAQRAALAKQLVALVRKDDSLVSLGWAFRAAVELGGASAAVADWIEGAIAQADEVDGRHLQFEGGLSVTALVVDGALRLSAALKRPAPLTAEQTVKFTRYFLSRRLVQNSKGGGLLLEVLETIAQTPAIAPVVVQTIGNGQLNGESPLLTVSVSDILGRALTEAQLSAGVTAEVRQAGKAATVVAAAKPLTKRSSDSTVYTLELPRLARGAYTVQVRVGKLEQPLPVRILGHVECKSAEIGIDSEGTLRKHEVAFGQKLEQELQADGQQKLWLQTALTEAGAEGALQVHQFFVRLQHRESAEEIIYVAEQDARKRYTFKLDVGARAADFGHRSGVYAVELIVGDASLVNSFRWVVAEVALNFGEEAAAEVREPRAAERFDNRAAKPEIKHTFRVPEKRPARLVSDLFTVLCAAPFAVLLVLWARLGVNVSNFPCSLSAVGFHVGFGAILALFGVFFWQLNMFETVRWLVPLALVTFFFGNRLLRSIAARNGSGGKA